MRSQYINIIILLAIITGLTFTTGCAKSSKKSRSALNYTATAKNLYDEAMVAFDRERWSDADKVFQEIRRQFPYSKYAPLSEVRMSDCQFELGSHAEAAVGYQHFLKAHPTHEEAHYAAYRRGVAYDRQIPSDFFITPPPHEKDQSATRDARATLGHYIRSYPSSEYQKEAQEIYIEVESALVRHEMYVAEFYLKRKKRKAAAVRLEGIATKFSKSPLVPDAMFLQAETFLKMNEIIDAKRVFTDIINMFPEHNQSLRAKDYLTYLGNKTTGLD